MTGTSPLTMNGGTCHCTRLDDVSRSASAAELHYRAHRREGSSPQPNRLRKGRPLLRVHDGDSAFDLLDVRPFMASHPLRIEQHGPLKGLSCPGHGRRT